MRVIQCKDDGIMFTFDSVKDVTEYCDGKAFVKSSVGDEWVGEKIDSFEQAMEKTRSAWEHGMDILTSFIERLYTFQIKELKSYKKIVTYSAEGGDEVDMDRMMEGRPDFYRTTTREASTGPTTVTIFIDTTTPAFIDSENILWRGAAAIALSKILEEKGYQTEIWVVNGSTLFESRQTRVLTSCCLKRCSDPFDISTLVNTVSGWCYRTVVFTLLRTIGIKTNTRIKESLGGAVTPSQDDLDLLSLDANRCYSSGAFSFSAALGVMKEQIEKMAADQGTAP